MSGSYSFRRGRGSRPQTAATCHLQDSPKRWILWTYLQFSQLFEQLYVYIRRQTSESGSRHCEHRGNHAEAGAAGCRQVSYVSDYNAFIFFKNVKKNLLQIFFWLKQKDFKRRKELTDETKATLRANLDVAVTEFLDHERATQASRSFFNFWYWLAIKKLFARILKCIIRGSTDSWCNSVWIFGGGES